MSMKLKLMSGIAALAGANRADSEIVVPAPAAAAEATTALIVPPAAQPAAAEPAAAAEEGEISVVAASEVAGLVAEARAEGAKAERERTSAVLGSPAAKSNYAHAAFMLEHNPAASAEAITASLATLPKVAQAAVAPLTTPLSATPVIAAPTGKRNDGSDKPIDAMAMLDDIQTSNAAMAKDPAVTNRGGH